MDNSSFMTLTKAGTRADGHVNATKWCKEFGYQLNTWKISPDTKARMKALNKHPDYLGITLCIVEGKGRSAITWVRPIMAIHLAQYLSPEFANFVAQTFQRYLEADASLAIEIIDRNNNPEDLKRIEQRAQTKRSNIGVNAAIKACGGEKVYPVIADMNNVAVTGQTAKDIKIARNVKQTSDGMTTFELSMIEAAEQLEEAALRSQKPRGDKSIAETCREVAETCREVADDISSLVKKYSQKQITPC